MTQRRTKKKTFEIWRGVFMIFLITSIAQSQTTVALTRERITTTLGSVDFLSGNSTDLRKPDKDVDLVPPTALNHDGERSNTPFYSSTTSNNQRTTTRTTTQSIQEEEYLQTNEERLKTVKSQINVTRNDKIPEATGEYLFEKLINSPSNPIINNKKQREFPTGQDYEDLNEHDKPNNREPTTPQSFQEPEIISLMNDTIVNYKGIIKPNIDEVIMTKNPKITLTNSSNMIGRYSQDSKNPKNQVELFKNLTLPKLMKLIGIEESNKQIETNNQTTKSSIVSDEQLNKKNDEFMNEKGSETPLKSWKIESSIENVESGNEKGITSSLTPKARTISFTGINNFNNNEEKVNLSKESNGLSKNEKPYPYLRGNTSETKSDEILVLENTIGRNQENKKSLITEPSVVVDNSIQQIKPIHFKRSGNVSSIDSNNSSGSSRTSMTLENNKSSNTSTTLSLVLQKNVDNVPESPEDNVDLTENGLTEAPEKNKTTITGQIYSNKDLFELSTESPLKSKKNSILPTINSSNITVNSTELPLSTLQISSSSLDSSTSSLIFSASSDLNGEITTSATSTISGTTSSEISWSASTSEFPDNSNGRAIDSTTTPSSVEYEFIGLTETTGSYGSSSDERNFVNNNEENSTISSTNLFSSSPTTISPVNDDESSTIEVTDDFTTVLTFTTDESDISTTDLNISDETTVTIDDTILDLNLETSTATTLNTEIVFEETTVDPRSIGTLESSIGTNNLSFSSAISPTTPGSSIVFESSSPSTISIGTTSTSASSLDSEMPSTEIISVDETTTAINTISFVTNETRAVPEDVSLLVRIVIEGTWLDVCPQISALRQSLADLLTAGIDKVFQANQIVFQENPCMDKIQLNPSTTEMTMPTLYLYVVNENGYFDSAITKILPTLYTRSPLKSSLTIRSFQLVQETDSGNTIAVIVVSCVAFLCLILLACLLFIMRKRQTRFNYGERCRPVSLDAYSLDSVSAYNSVRRKGAMRASKRSYGNPTFEDSSAVPSHPLNFGGLSAFCNEQNAISEEFTTIPQVSARIDELPPGAEVKNRYANVVPLPETRVQLMKINNDPLSEYINASYVRGPKNATKYYIACQAPIESTVTDFWRMIWEQQSKVIIMLTDLIENGVEKCAEYIPPSEVTDCHRLYGDYQVTLKKRETKEKYAISTLHLKNLENNTYREISHIWYLWPANGVQTDATGLIAVLLEARALQRGGPGPIVVHCSPGTGRTGTLIALDLGIRQYEITRTVDVPRVVYTIRRDRAGAVQTKEQYAFIYKALNLYATKLAGGGLEST